MTRLSGHERFFEIESLGETEPAATQELRLRLLRKAPLGRHAVKVTVDLDPAGKSLEWHVDLRVVGAIQAAPDSLQFGRVKRDQVKPQQIRLLSFTGRLFDVTGVTSRQGYFIAEPKGTGGGWIVTVRPAPGLSLKTPYRDHIEITTNDPDMPKLVVEAFVELVG